MTGNQSMWQDMQRLSKIEQQQVTGHEPTGHFSVSSLSCFLPVAGCNVISLRRMLQTHERRYRLGHYSLM